MADGVRVQGWSGNGTSCDNSGAERLRCRHRVECGYGIPLDAVCHDVVASVVRGLIPQHLQLGVGHHTQLYRSRCAGHLARHFTRNSAPCALAHLVHGRNASVVRLATRRHDQVVDVDA